MSPKTKNRVIYGRYIQLFLRVCALVGALGALFCVICIKNTTTAVGWIIRVAVSLHILNKMMKLITDVFIASGSHPTYRVWNISSVSKGDWTDSLVIS
jgi:predicted secreted protein